MSVLHAIVLFVRALLGALRLYEAKKADDEVKDLRKNPTAWFSRHFDGLHSAGLEREADQTSPASITQLHDSGTSKTRSLSEQGIRDSTRGIYNPTRKELPMKIVIDPGHGGDNTGAVGNGIVESEWTFKTALALHELTGWEILRGPDETVSLSQRGVRSRGADAGLVICLHVNSNSSPALRGTTTYYLMHQPEMHELGRDIARCGMNPWKRSFHEPVLAHNGPGLQDDWLQAPVNVMTPHADHALVLLVEAFFLSNSADAALAHNDSSVEEFAKCVRMSVESHFFLG